MYRQPGRFVIVPLLLWATGAVALNGLDAIREQIRAGRLDAAATQLEAYLVTRPDDPQARFLNSVVLVRQGRTEAAIASLRKLAKDYPRLPEPYNNLAVLYAAQSDYEAARDALLQAIKAHPGYATAHENLGDIYVKMAADAYDRAVRLDRGNGSAKDKLALLDRVFARAPTRPPEAGEARPASADTLQSPIPAATGAVRRAAVRASLEAWARAWSNQDVEGYLASYAASFVPPGGLSRAAWERQRRVRLERPARIEIKLSGWRFQTIGEKRAELSLTQDYRSDSYRDRVRKRIVMIKGERRWRIAGEELQR